MRFVSKILLSLLPVFAMAAASANDFPSIEVNGLFGNQAVLTINGKQRILRKGQRSPEGVLLVSSTLSHVVIRHSGTERKLRLSQRVAGNYKQVEQNGITIPADSLGQYRVQITVGGQPVTALVDTGASVIAISSAQADRLGIDYLAGQQGQVVTANGRATSFFVELPEVTVVLTNNRLSGSIPVALNAISGLNLDIRDNEISDLSPALCDERGW